MPWRSAVREARRDRSVHDPRHQRVVADAGRDARRAAGPGGAGRRGLDGGTSQDGSTRATAASSAAAGVSAAQLHRPRPLRPQGRAGEAAGRPAGKRIGMYDWVASGSIWYRHFLSFIGVPLGELDGGSAMSTAAASANHGYTLPDGVHAAPEGRSLSEMLIAGELDAIYSPPRPRDYHPVDWADRAAVPRLPRGRAGLFPPDPHVSAAAPDGAAARGVGGNKWIARSLTEAFVRADAMFCAGAAQFPLCRRPGSTPTGGDRGPDGRRLPP